MKVQFTINGVDAVVSQIGESIREAAREQFLEELRGYRCPDHGKPIEDLQLSGGQFVGDYLDNMKLKILACCDQAIDEASDLIGAEG